MKTSKLYLHNILLTLCLLANAVCSQGQKTALELQTAAKRKEKDAEFAKPATSPLDSLDALDFSHLNYFDPDPRFLVHARVTKYKRQKKFKMPTSTDRAPVYKRWGQLEFTLNDSDCVLVLYQNVELVKKEEYANHLFLPFTDLTNGLETYGGGRYLDLEITNTDFFTLDFNGAYNPYCAYSVRWSCPIPPEENHLALRIEAGEKVYHQDLDH